MDFEIPKDYLCLECHNLLKKREIIGPATPDGFVVFQLKYVPSGIKLWHGYNCFSKHPLCKLCPDKKRTALTDEKNLKRFSRITYYDGKKPYVLFDPNRYDRYKILSPDYRTEINVRLFKIIIHRLTTIIPSEEELSRPPDLIDESTCLPVDTSSELVPYTPELTKSEIIVSGSFALHAYLKTLPESWEMRWIPEDIDIFFMNSQGRNNANRFRIRQRLLSHIVSEMRMGDWVSKCKASETNIDFVRTGCKDVVEFINSVDISITGVCIVHSTAIPEDPNIKVIQEYKPFCTDTDKWFIIASIKAIEDVEKKQQTCFRKQDVFPLYSKAFSRIAKYYSRGFINVVHEPRDIKNAIGGYLDD